MSASCQWPTPQLCRWLDAYEVAHQSFVAAARAMPSTARAQISGPIQVSKAGLCMQAEGRCRRSADADDNHTCRNPRKTSGRCHIRSLNFHWSSRLERSFWAVESSWPSSLNLRMCLMPSDEPSDDALLWMTLDGRDEDILEPPTTACAGSLRGRYIVACEAGFCSPMAQSRPLTLPGPRDPSLSPPPAILASRNAPAGRHAGERHSSSPPRN